MRISIDHEVCVSAGNCVLRVPEVFDQDEDGLAITLVAAPPAEIEALVREAADTCPSGAISLLED